MFSQYFSIIILCDNLLSLQPMRYRSIVVIASADVIGFSLEYNHFRIGRALVFSVLV